MGSGQYALVMSCTDSHPMEIVKLIVNEDEFSKSRTLFPQVTAYPWHIDTKYYTTDVHICTLDDNSFSGAKMFLSVEAVILHFNSDKKDALDSASCWLPLIKELNPEIRILVCDRCLEKPESGTSKLAAQEWCIAHGFELVELNAELDEEWEQEQDFIETTGVARIIQALHAFMWPNLNLKDQSNSGPLGLQSLLLNGANGATVPLSTSSSHATNGHSNDLVENMQNINLGRENENGYELLDEALDEGSLKDDYFELFQNLAAMKERVGSMPSEERKACAERVVRAFWTAMGGDRSELSDSD